jgi:hypothetical protein
VHAAAAAAAAASAPLMDKRGRLVAGDEKVGAYGIADSDEPGETKWCVIFNMFCS